MRGCGRWPRACCSRHRSRLSRLSSTPAQPWRPRATRRSRTRSSARTPSPGHRRATWDVSGAGAASIQGFATEHQRQPRPDRPLQGRHRRHRLPPGHLPDGLLRGRRRPQDRDGPALGEPAPKPARLPERRPATGLVDCGNWAESASWAVPVERRIGDLLRQARARGRHARRKPRLLRRPRRRRRLGPPLPDLRHDLAGLQPVRRQQPLHRRARNQSGPRLQGELQPPLHDARRHPRGLALQRRVSDGALARAKRIRRQLLHRRGRPPPRVRDPRSRDLPVGGARRVLVRRAAHERRGRPRRRRQPRLLQRQRELLEDPLGEEHRRVRHRQPDPRLLQGDPRQRQDRPHLDLDGDLARPASVQPAGRPPRERPVRDDLHGQRRHLGDPGAGGRRQAAPVAEHQRRLAGPRSDRDPGRQHPRLRVGRGPRQRRSARRPDRPLLHHPRRPAADPGLRLDLRPRHRHPQPHPVPRPERRAGVRGGDDPVVVGTRRQPRPRRLHPGPAHAAGDREPARRHGRPTRHASGRAHRRHRLDRHRRAELRDRLPERAAPT